MQFCEGIEINRNMLLAMDCFRKHMVIHGFEFMETLSVLFVKVTEVSLKKRKVVLNDNK
jgi:hypothetical protein